MGVCVHKINITPQLKISKNYNCMMNGAPFVSLFVKFEIRIGGACAIESTADVTSLSANANGTVRRYNVVGRSLCSAQF